MTKQGRPASVEPASRTLAILDQRFNLLSQSLIFPVGAAQEGGSFLWGGKFDCSLN
jgi:hypothetical protein